jgi:hypothetical protein
LYKSKLYKEVAIGGTISKIDKVHMIHVAEHNNLGKQRTFEEKTYHLHTLAPPEHCRHVAKAMRKRGVMARVVPYGDPSLYYSALYVYGDKKVK